MTRTWIIGALVLALGATLAPDSADARRMGGGKSFGMQRSMPARTAPDAAPARPAQPQQAAPNQAAPNPAAAANPGATAGKRNWLGPVAGLAAGLGLAALMSHLGLGEAFGSFVLLALLVMAGFALLTFMRRRMAAPALAASTARPQGAAAASQVAWPAPAAPQTPSPTAPHAQSAFAPAAAAPAGRVFVPAAFDEAGFARIAKAIFIRMQAANDAADLDDLRQFTTPEVFASIKLDLLERGSAAQTTEVQRIDATVLDVADEPGQQIVSVRYRGEVVEARGETPVAVDEVWHLVRARNGDEAWRIAGIEQMA